MALSAPQLQEAHPIGETRRFIHAPQPHHNTGRDFGAGGIAGAHLDTVFSDSLTSDTVAHKNHIFDLRDIPNLAHVGEWATLGQGLGSERDDELVEKRARVFAKFSAGMQESMGKYFALDMHITREQKQEGLSWILKNDNPKSLKLWLRLHSETLDIFDVAVSACENGATHCVVFLMLHYFEERGTARLGEMIAASISADSIDLVEFLLNFIRPGQFSFHSDNMLEHLNANSLDEPIRDDVGVNEIAAFAFQILREKISLDDQKSEEHPLRRSFSVVWQNPFTNPDCRLYLDRLTEYAGKFNNFPLLDPTSEDTERAKDAFDNLRTAMVNALIHIAHNREALDQLLTFCTARVFKEYQTANKIYRNVWLKLVTHHTPYAWNQRIRDLKEVVRCAVERIPADLKNAAQPDFGHPVHAYADLCRLQTALSLFLFDIAAKSGGTTYIPAVKGFQRIVEKCVMTVARNEVFGHSDGVFDHWDYVRGTINFKTLGGLDRALFLLLDPSSSVFKLQSVSFRFRSHNKKNSQLGAGRELTYNEDPNNWQDIALYGKFNPSMQEHDDKLKLTVEIQLSLVPFTNARKGLGGHEMYAQYRLANDIKKLFTEEDPRTHVVKTYEEVAAIIQDSQTRGAFNF